MNLLFSTLNKTTFLILPLLLMVVLSVFTTPTRVSASEVLSFKLADNKTGTTTTTKPATQTPPTSGTTSGTTSGSQNQTGKDEGSTEKTKDTTIQSGSLKNGGKGFVDALDQSVGEFANPIESRNLPELIVRGIRVMLALVGGAATIVIVIAGFQLVVSGSIPAKRTAAIRAITWAVAGLILSLMSFSIVAILQNIISR